MGATPRTVAFVFNLLLLLGLTCSFLVQFCLMITEEGEPKEDHFVTLVNFQMLPENLPVGIDPKCKTDPKEDRTLVNLVASMTGFRPIIRLIIVFITLTGLLYYLVELTYLPFILTALDVLTTTLSTIFYIFKHSRNIFHTRECIYPAVERVVESLVILINFVLLALACLYIVNLIQCRVVLEAKKGKYSFVHGSKNDLKKINRMVGYETRRNGKSRKSKRSSSKRNTSSRVSKRSESRSISSRSDNSRSDTMSTRSTTLSHNP